MKDNYDFFDKESVKKLLQHYSIGIEERSSFILQTDWLIELSVYPKEETIVSNLSDLWNIYMPDYEFDKVVIEYMEHVFPVLMFINENGINKYDSIFTMVECAVKNYIKKEISKGNESRLSIITSCCNYFNECSVHKSLYDTINKIIELYFPDGEINKLDSVFLQRFNSNSEYPYTEIYNRISNIYNSRKNLADILKVPKERLSEFHILINIMLCSLAMNDDNNYIEDKIKNSWSNYIKFIPYNKCIYDYLQKNARHYITASLHGVPNIENEIVIRQLYKESLILHYIINTNVPTESITSININDYYRDNGSIFGNKCFFENELIYMKTGFDRNILIQHSDVLNALYHSIISRMKTPRFSSKDIRSSKYATATGKMNLLNNAKKEEQIDRLKEKNIELTKKIEGIYIEALSEFIKVLDDQKYDYVLGKLFRIAYSDDECSLSEIKRTVKNLFEIMKLSGIETYGPINEILDFKNTDYSLYRAEQTITGNAVIKYPGYKIDNNIIISPYAEEV